MPRLSYVLLATTWAATFLPAARAETADASLARAVPAGVYIFVHGFDNPEREFLDKHWAAVWQRFKDTKVDQDIRDLIFSAIPPEQKQTTQATWDQWMGMIRTVNWSGLFGREVVFAGRMMFPTPEYIVLTRPTAESFEGNLAALKGLFGGVAKMAGVPELAESAIDGGKMWTLAIADSPVSVHLVQHKEVIGLGFGKGLINQALDLLSGKAGRESLTASPRFREAFAGLPPAEDARVFFDMAALMDGLEKILTVAMEPPGGVAPPGQTPETQPGQGQSPQEIRHAQLLKMGRAIISELRILDYIASVEYTEGLRTVEVTNTALGPDARDKALFKVFCGGNEIKKFDEFIPKEATSFSVASGFDLAALYRAVVDFVRKEVPDGEAVLARWEGVQQEMNFNVEKDLLAWLGSKSVSISMPASMPLPMGGGDWVQMVQVTDPQAASEKVNEWLAALSAKLPELAEATPVLAFLAQPLMITPANIEGAEGFQTVTHPAIMMFIRPVIGVKDGYLIMGSSAGAVEKVLATAAGRHPSIIQSEQFKREGLTPAGPVQSVSYKDIRNRCREIGQAMGMVGIVGQFIPPDNPGAAGVRAVLGIVQKLGPVVASIDFYESTASVCSFDGRRFQTRSITNYKPYVEPPATQPAAAGEAPGAPQVRVAGTR